MHFNGQTFSGVFGPFFISKILVLKMQNSSFFLIKNGFESSVYIIDDWVVTNWSVPLEKHQTFEILLRVDFYAFLKMLHFSKCFKIFKIHQ